jgi:hypothetical protein
VLGSGGGQSLQVADDDRRRIPHVGFGSHQRRRSVADRPRCTSPCWIRAWCRTGRDYFPEACVAMQLGTGFDQAVTFRRARATRAGSTSKWVSCSSPPGRARRARRTAHAPRARFSVTATTPTSTRRAAFRCRRSSCARSRIGRRFKSCHPDHMFLHLAAVLLSAVRTRPTSFRLRRVRDRLSHRASL